MSDVQEHCWLESRCVKYRELYQKALSISKSSYTGLGAVLRRATKQKMASKGGCEQTQMSAAEGSMDPFGQHAFYSQLRRANVLAAMA